MYLRVADATTQYNKETLALLDVSLGTPSQSAYSRLYLMVSNSVSLGTQ